MTDHAAAAADGDAPTPLTITSRQRVLILVGTLIGMLVAAVSQTIVTTVLPSMDSHIGPA